ncbi:hypothetical protein GHT06_012806 [Daphnia sinensis]|uniref:Mitochondrial nucleoid factor 1 n=1 Tax=Daphnia sinensis TaxID=1820382 RepID=A0AAD5KWA9_9CRUS|nr:hypothetical protein GHT06_012806 [Daphnia sinensis]
MSSSVFRKVTLLLSKWPLDLSKKGRDIGEHIRQKVATSFPQGETSKVDVQEWTNFVEHLGNIANNKSLTNHPRVLKSSATGLSVEECKEIVSTDFLSYVRGQANPNKVN